MGSGGLFKLNVGLGVVSVLPLNLPWRMLGKISMKVKDRLVLWPVLYEW